MDRYNLISFAGIFLILGTAWIFSSDRRSIALRPILAGMILQILFALFVFTVPAGSSVFLFINDRAVEILNASVRGIAFLFGPLALSPGNTGSLGFILAFQSLPTIIFFSALVSVLYYIGFLPFIIRKAASFFSKTLRISGAESIAAASNIFVGVESALTVKPYLPTFTKSELTLLLTVGMATVASNVLALYVFTLQDVFPAIAGHLISASLLSAPAAVVISKIMVPEKETPSTSGETPAVHYVKDNSLFEAIIAGADNGLKVAVGVATLLVAVLGLTALADLILGYGCSLFTFITHVPLHLTMTRILGWLFYPFTLILGIPPHDTALLAPVIGERLILTEVASYTDLATLMREGLLTHPRSAVIAAYTLCGFTHVASMAIFAGGISALIPGRKGDVSRAALRGLAAATLATLLTGAVAGTFYHTSTVLFK